MLEDNHPNQVYFPEIIISQQNKEDLMLCSVAIVQYFTSNVDLHTSENSAVSDGHLSVHAADWAFLPRPNLGDLCQLLQSIHHGSEDQAVLEVLVLQVGHPDHEL